MTASQWWGIGGFALLFALIGLAFRRGMRVKPDPENKPSFPDHLP